MNVGSRRAFLSVHGSIADLPFQDLAAHFKENPAVL